MIKYNLLIFIVVVYFNTQRIQGQINISNFPEKCYKYQICSKNKKNVISDVTHYNSKLKWIHASSGLSTVSGCYKFGNDSVKQATITSKGYYPLVIEINPLKRYPTDTIFINRITKDSIYAINSFVYDVNKKIDLELSKLNIDTYCNFLKNHIDYSFKLICFKDDKTSVDNLTVFYKEITKRFPQLIKRVIIEYSDNQRYSNGMYITGKRLK